MVVVVGVRCGLCTEFAFSFRRPDLLHSSPARPPTYPLPPGLWVQHCCVCVCVCVCVSVCECVCVCV